jgi:hypothetical protein
MLNILRQSLKNDPGMYLSESESESESETESESESESESVSESDSASESESIMHTTFLNIALKKKSRHVRIYIHRD